MTEKEKLALGVLYDPYHCEELFKEREICKTLCQKYNQLPYGDYEGRKEILRRIIGKFAGDFIIEPPFICDYGYNISVGKNFYANHNLVILDATKVEIGDNVFIAPDCGIYAAGHPLDVEDRNAGLEYAFPVKIGNNVWIGGHVCIMPGVTIGDNTVIAGGSVVVEGYSFGRPRRRKSLAASFAKLRPRIKINTAASDTALDGRRRGLL